MWRCAIVASTVLFLNGCLSPLAEDEVVEKQDDTLLLPGGTDILSLPNDPAIDLQVDENDGVERLVPLIGGFAQGEYVRYWDFGPAPRTVAPVWVFGTADEDGGLVKLENHPVLFDVAPGDAAYTPIWQVYAVFVTDAYDGELITSPAAIDEAQIKGLVKEPVPVPMYVNCPVVHPDVRLQVDDTEEAREPIICFYKGKRCYYFDFAPALTPAEPYEDFPVQNMFVLRREGGEPLSEPLRHVDMTGDEDTLDTNDIFTHGVASATYTPLVYIVETVIPADAGSIDDSSGETEAEFQDSEQLFDESSEGIDPREPVVAFEEGHTLLNRPQQLVEVEGGE
jgi:hypothetical protein